MEKLHTEAELFELICRMNKKNSVSQVYIPGKGTFTIVLQDEDHPSIDHEVSTDPELRQMIHDSRADYRIGNGMTTKEFIKSISISDFKK